MSMKVNQWAYEQMIAEDVAVLLTLPKSLERNHIEAVLRHSITTGYNNPDIKKLDEEVEELTKDRDHWKVNHGNMVVKNAFLSQRTDLPVDRIQAYKQLTTQLQTETAARVKAEQREGELMVYVERLRDVLNQVNYAASVTVGDKWLNAVLKETPTQSLQVHDAAIEEEVIERSAGLAETGSGNSHTVKRAGCRVRNQPRLYDKKV